ncbi:MAG: DUF4147 domain-containing protein [Phycisphaerales bacterium]
MEEARTANAPAITALISGGASSLICEPIPGLDLDDYRSVVQAMLAAGWDIKLMNTVRRAIDELKGGGLGLLAAPLPVDLLVISDVVGATLHDVGSGPFVTTPTDADDAWRLLSCASDLPSVSDAILEALNCRPRGDSSPAPRRAAVVLSNHDAVAAASAALTADGLSVVSERADCAFVADTVAWSALRAVEVLEPGEAIVWGGEWSTPGVTGAIGGVGGRCQYIGATLDGSFSRHTRHDCMLVFATDGTDGIAPPGKPTPAGAFIYAGMSVTPASDPPIEGAGDWYDDARNDEEDRSALYYWEQVNSYHVIAHRDRHRSEGEPPSHIFTGPTGTNVNDLLVAWRR